MAKAEWGTKRRCTNCGAGFYDLGKTPILCPKCGTEINPDAVMKTRRPAKVEEKAAPKPQAKPIPAEDIADGDLPDADIDDEFIEEAADIEEEDVGDEIDVDAEPDPGEER